MYLVVVVPFCRRTTLHWRRSSNAFPTPTTILLDSTPLRRFSSFVGCAADEGQALDLNFRRRRRRHRHRSVVVVVVAVGGGWLVSLVSCRAGSCFLCRRRQEILNQYEVPNRSEKAEGGAGEALLTPAS